MRNEFRASVGAAPLTMQLDCESAALLRQILLPVVEAATDWPGLAGALARKGYGLTFRRGRMVIVQNETGRPVSTGRGLGMPLAGLAARLGRPSLRLSRDGCSAELHA
ncbi:hypothetical protein [Salipiger bermudensis]|uniref:hypothetical protein n=1 Tax=Salipiger bermudensis TaxID=344736 RepID=UPI001CD7326F|nr:hypothetical protein [Salipiger bermudensis]MCA0962491.1 hypothetical protein [Salipiger bermudensis]